MSQDVLFLSHRMPFPPDRGDKIRSHHILKRLATLAPVHVATFADDDRDMGEEVELAALARSYSLVRRIKPLALAGLQALYQRRPVGLPAFYSDEIAAYVACVLKEHPIETIYVFSGQMGQYVPDSFKGRVICDFVDADSAKYDAYGDRHGGVRGWFERREGRMLRAEEQRIACRADVSLLISPDEAALFAARLDPVARAECDVRVLGNGTDSLFFDPATVRAQPELSALPQPRLIFTGQMDYAPNVEAVQRAVSRIMPRIREVFPDASFHVVGRKPPDELRALDGVNGCRVWGEVDDIRHWLIGADIALIPLDLARGIQNKVLEAMSMAMPVVLTSAAATGIPAEPGRHFAVADDDEGLAQQAIDLLAHPRRGWSMSVEARKFVVERMSWPAALVSLPQLIGRAPAADARDAA